MFDICWRGVRKIRSKINFIGINSCWSEDNVILLEGNHDTRLRQYLQEEQVIIPQKDKEVLLKYFSKEEVKELTKNNIKSTEFIRNTIPQIEHINENSLKDLCNHFAQLTVLDFNNRVYFITHGGVPKLPTPKTPTTQLVRGVGKYEDLPELYKAWETNAPHNYVQIHAHRNLQGYTIPVDETGLVYNLCDNIEDGGYLRVLEITKEDIGLEPIIYGNSVVKPFSANKYEVKNIDGGGRWSVSDIDKARIKTELNDKFYGN